MKEFDRFIEEAAAKRCPPGKYWCYDSKKCKKIPLGYHIGNRGYLEHADNGSNGNGGNGNGSNGGNGGGNGGS